MTTKPTADQPLVTHEDLSALRKVRDYLPSKVTGDFETDAAVALVDSFIQAAEADKPALPEGWVLYADGIEGERVLWHHEGALYIDSDRAECWQPFVPPGSLTPLVTAASLAPEGWHVGEDVDGRPTIRDADERLLLSRTKNGDPSPIFDVLATLVSAAQAERGESR